MFTRLLGRLIWVLGATGEPTAAQPFHQPPLGRLVRFVRIRDAGHLVHEEAPDAMASQLLPPCEVARGAP